MENKLTGITITKTLLLEVDIQNDFCPNGALAVPDGDKVIPSINALAVACAAAGGVVAATQDWHPADHVSFASSHPGKGMGDIIDLTQDYCSQSGQQQVLWPDHCVRGTYGAAFHAGLDLKPMNLIIRKGFRQGLDSYSAFFENDRKTPTGLEGWMRGIGIETILIGGLATDYCVFYSAMDARSLGFTTIIVSDAVRGVGYPAGSVEKAMADMQAAGITFSASRDLLEAFANARNANGAWQR
ncbi:MAG: bifunctional nicotinamidase/pyrazinamidase [Treponema sp.]|nr:bifunctional nicotinamidase/pyrazinamidase [Treponema sp.]